ncbi:MAG: hypothetical protein RJA10_1837 [Pseudomonadota bacterium]|jgi:hypothetical protein
MYTPEMAADMALAAGAEWKPSNGTEGEIFWSEWCSRCERDRVMNGSVWEIDAGDDDYCPILNASFRGEAAEWVIGTDGQPTCKGFVPIGQPLHYRCEHTPDLFDMGAQA